MRSIPCRQKALDPCALKTQCFGEGGIKIDPLCIIVITLSGSEYNPLSFKGLCRELSKGRLFIGLWWTLKSEISRKTRNDSSLKIF